MNEPVVNNVPLSRLVYMCECLGSQETDACPPHETNLCWLERGLKGYMSNESGTDDECRECWMLWLMKGQ